jgi:predicted exporter
VTRRAWILVLLWLAIVAAAAAQILRTPFSADLSAFLPADPDAQQRVLIEQLESGLPARTLLIGIDGGSATTRAQASRALAERLRSSGHFEQVQNGQNEAWADTGQWLFEHRYHLSPAVGPQRFTPAGLREGIDDSLSLLGTPAGNAFKPLLERDPTGETTRVAESLIPSSAPRSVEGVWAAREGERALLLAINKAPGADLDAQQQALQRLQDEFAALKTEGLALKVSGAPVFGVNSRAQIEQEVRSLAIAGTVLMSALLLLAFGSLKALAVAALPVATGVVVGIAAVSLVFGGVHGMTLGFGTTLIGEAVDYAIYYLIQARQAGRAQWENQGWPTVRLGLLTSVCGFAALVFSGFPGLQQLGVFSVAGLVAAALFTRYVMPLMMPLGAQGQGLRQPLGRAAGRAMGWLPRLRRPLLALGVAAAGLLLVQRQQLWSAELSSLSPVSSEALALDASLRADVSAGDAKTLAVVSAPDLQATLQKAEAAAKALDTLVEQGQIAGYDTITRLLPSLAQQQARLAALPQPEPLRAALVEATAGGPLPASRLEPFVAEVQAARDKPVITAQALRAVGLAPVLDALLLQRKDGSWVALLPVQPHADRGVDAQVLRQALAGVPGAQVLDIGAELRGLYQRYLGQAQNQAMLGAVGVLLFIAFTLRSVKRLLSVCQPLLLSVLLTMGLFTALGVQLGILHLVGLLLVVAVGSNYALFFNMLQHEGQASADTLASLLLANVTTVLSFGLIALSGIPALAAIGRVVALGALLALVLSAAFATAARPK